MSLRETIKDVGERLLVASGAVAVARTRLSRGILVLAYHNIVPDGAGPIGDVPNHLPFSTFAAQLDTLQAGHEVVPITEALEPRPPSRRPRVAITFDDAYAGAIRHGIPELVRRGLPATVFVAPGFLGGRSFWWDALSGRPERGLDPHLRAEALDTLRGQDTAVRAWARRHGIPEVDVPDVAVAASEEALHEAAALPGIAVGSHTWGHPNLTCLDRETLIRELVRPLEWLRERFPAFVPWLAYPYGAADDRVAAAAGEAGYEGAFLIAGGWMRKGAGDPFTLPRLNIPPGLSLNGFKLRVAGIGA